MRDKQLAVVGRTAQLLLLAATLTCRSATAPPRRVASGTSLAVAADHTSHADASTEDRELDAIAGTYRREAERLGRAEGLYVVHPQTPPSQFVDLRKRRPSPEPRSPRARMFAFGFGYGCDGDRLVRADGTICSGAAYPGSTLTDAQTARAAEILRSSATSWSARPRAQCFEPHHAIVLFDEQEAPVAELTVCFECNSFRVTPGPLDEAEATESEAAFFADTCRDLHVGACPPPGASRMPDFPPAPEDALPEPERRALQLRARLEPHEGVPADRLLRDMTPLERDLVCAWVGRAMRLAVNGHYTCGDGRTVWVDDPPGCKRWPPSACTATVDDVVTCTRLRVTSPCGAETSACNALAACRWGLLETTAAAGQDR
jgi:hypothetical protein